ncbi:MAG TPA: glycosyltransferase, partial [Bacillota bacterium]|nr:glycosyltransferase [Bacillota bacterium]
MRIVLATFGSYGDLDPFIWMGRTLQKAGHEIFLIANPYFEERIKSEGFQFYPAGTVEDYQTAVTPAVVTGNRFRDQGGAIEASQRLFTYMFLKPVRETYETIAGLNSNAGAKDLVIIHHFFAYGARLAAEKLQVPGFNVCLAPYWLRGLKKAGDMATWMENGMAQFNNRFVDRILFTKPFNRLRGEIGLPPLKQSSSEWMFSGKNLGLFPEWLHDFEVADGLKLDYVGFPEANPSNQPLPERLREFLNRYPQPVVFTPGSAVTDSSRFLSEAAEALEKLNLPGIFLTRFPEKLPPGLPERIMRLDFVPLNLLLDHCGAIVHHGGIGTTAQALKCGTPQLICYRMAEQADNARWLKR